MKESPYVPRPLLAGGKGNHFLSGLKNKSVYHFWHKNLSRLYLMFLILNLGSGSLKTEIDRQIDR